MNYTLLELTRVACMGNTHDGWVTCCLARKETEGPFLDGLRFAGLPVALA